MATISSSDVMLNVWLVNPKNPKDPSQADIQLAQPTKYLPGAANLIAPEIHAQGAVTIRGRPGDSVGFWRFGFIQLKFITTDWAHYRGPTEADGSVFVAADRGSGRPGQLCRDTYLLNLKNSPIMAPRIFYNEDKELVGEAGEDMTGYLPQHATIPDGNGSQLVKIKYRDRVARGWDLTEFNKSFHPPRENYLYSLQSGSAFATMFAVQKGHGQPIEVMKHFQWNVRWRVHFHRSPTGEIVQLPLKSPNDARLSVSTVHSGKPVDPLFRFAITDDSLPVCLEVVKKAFEDPVRLESRKWEDWKVGH